MTNIRAWFTLFFVIFVLAVFSVIISSLIQQYKETAALTAERLGQPIVRRAAAFVDGDAFERLSETLDPADPFYEETRLKLLALKEEFQCLYLYTMAPYEGTVHRFIIDGGNPEEEDFSPLGALEDIREYEAAYLLTYETKKPQSGAMNFHSTWGWGISAYMPILNSAGEAVGVIGCDFEAESVYKAIRSRILQQVSLAVFFIAIAFVFYIVLLKAVTRQNLILTRLNEEMKAASESKSMFLARMSHEIRTPMNAIIGMSELAARDYGRPEALECIESIRRAGVNLLTVINEILDFSKIEAGSLEIASAPYETAALVNDVLNIIRVRLADKPVELKTDISPDFPGILIGDEARVRQILLNLLSNAVKYTQEGFVKLSASSAGLGDGKVKLTFVVEDSGLGVKSEDIPKLFSEFTRLDLIRNQNVEGAGLGLSITMRLCQAMGGEVEVKSEYGRGSVFVATITQSFTDPRPMGALTESARGAQEAPGAGFVAPAARVLVVDDIAMNIAVAEGLLSPYQVKVDSCRSGEEAVRLIQEKRYDFILMDHMMPGMDGIETTRAVRALEGTYFKEVPIIALTANAMSGMREMFLENGFNDYISKPIELSALSE
ncbi:MAG: response regulator, partial [Candidatus Adiutrix sp.]|nr:response regulator [Candidatus Adiutrix sp.]